MSKKIRQLEYGQRSRMFINYIKIAVRNLFKSKGYSFINISGLALGATCCLLITLYVTDEHSYDRFHEKGDQIYRVHYCFRRGENLPPPSKQEFRSWGNALVGPQLEADFPEVLHAVRFSGHHTLLMAYDDRSFQEENYFFTDSTVFKVFTFPLLQGDPQKALSHPFSIVLSQSAAQRYFSNEDPMGQSLLLATEQPLTVTGIMADIPRTSSIAFDMLISMDTMEEHMPWSFRSWGYADFYNYFLLPDEVPISELEAKMPDFILRHIGDWFNPAIHSYDITFEPLKSNYFSPATGFMPGPIGNMSNSTIFSAIGLFILAIACVNFMNLATARSSERAREIGMRKVVGARKVSLVGQFLTESFVMTLIAMLVAPLLAGLSLPIFRQLSGKALSGNLYFNPVFVLIYFAVALAVGLLAGSYPAFMLSRFRPAMVLKGAFKTSSQGIGLRRGLVVLQFSISVALIAGTIIVLSQLDYMQNHQLGFEKEQMLMIDFGGDDLVRQQMDAIKQSFLNHPAVSSVSTPRSVPGGFFPRAGTQIQNSEGIMQEGTYHIFQIDYDFIPHFNLEMAAGRAYYRHFPTDLEGALVINEAVARELGYTNPADAVGKAFEQWGREGMIIGVARDFNFVSLHKPIEPMTLSLSPGSARYFVLRMTTENLTYTLSEIEQIWKRMASHRPFLYSFLDDSFDQQYRAEMRFGQLFGFFAGLAIFIACLGLFGLAGFTTAQRTKEVGVRKVFGASVVNIVLLLSKDFVRLVLIAFVIAIPAIYLSMSQWLNGFAYRITIHWWIFVVAGGVALFVALLTVCSLALRTANANPVDSLKYE